MGCSLIITLAAFSVAGYFVTVARGNEAKILLESVDNKTIYQLNHDILAKISELQGPIRVIAAIGNARVGKSTTLNLISHIWNGKEETSAVEEIFKTGHTHKAVTRNVWAHIIKPKNETGGNIVLLDVEGTELGDDRVTDRLSTFTSMMSSALNVFALNIIRNGDIEFLYRMARLSDLVFKDKYILPNFPKLRIVLRSELDPPGDDEIRDEIFKRGREKAKIIQKYFPRSTIEVTHIPTVNGNRPLKDQKKLSKSDWGAFQSLAKDLQNCPEKRSFEGSLIDGTSFKQLAKDVVEAMNSDDSWKDFGDVYATLERDICRRTYEKHIGPVVMQSSKEIGDKMIEALDEFKKECVLEDEINKTREELKVTLKKKREQEEKDRRREEEEVRRREKEERKRRASLFMKFNKTEKTFELNQTVLEELSRLQRPIRVIAAVGDARVGKSTTMNLISHIWTKVNRNKVEEIFETGDTQEPVTRDVWCHVIQDERGGNVVLLDVEGTNLGDDALTIQLSMFTALISSGLNMFVREGFQNNNLHFLFHMSRLSDLVFPNMTIQNFPKLQVVIRGALSGVRGRTIEDYTRDSIVEPSLRESMQEERKTIAKHFPRNQIAVSQIPYVSREQFKDFEKLRESDYWTKMEQLVDKFKEFPVKKTLRGTPIDGRGLVELAVRLAETMNADSWPDFANVYDAVERNICKRSYVKLIEPLFSLMKAEEIEEKSGGALEAFKLECELEGEIVAAQKDLRRIAEDRRKTEELEVEAKKAESERLAAEKRHEKQEKKFQHELSIKDGQIAKVKKEKEEAEIKERNFKQLLEEQLKTIALLQRKLSKKSSSWLDFFVPVIVGAGFAMSDRDLKLNITTLPHSPYNVIGLDGACWKWNEIAEKTFGLAGEECGVIAQEVKKLYPLAVTRGKNGYLMVRYDVLNEIVNDQRTKKCTPEC